MEYANVKEWLDKLIRNTEERKSLVFFNSRIRTYYVHSEIAIDNYIDEVADAMEIGLTEEKMKDGYFRYFFKYRDYTFYQVTRERLERFAGNDK